MTTTITGLGSGFDIDSWVSQLVSAKESSTVKPLKTKLSTLETKNQAVSALQSKYTSLQSALQTFTRTIYNSSSDMWSNTKIKSSNEAYATASSSGSVASANVDLKIEQVATSTVAKSAHSLGLSSKDDILNTKFTNLANSQAKDGTFSMFLDGKQYEIKIEESDKVSDVIDKIKTVSDGKIQASIDDDGIFTIKAYSKETLEDGSVRYEENKNSNLVLGSNGDTSNMLTALKLYNKDGSSSISSAYPVQKIKTSVAMMNEESGLTGLKFYDENGNPATKGTVTINGVDFEIDENTSLNNLIQKINGNSKANVKASYDSLTNKISLTSTQTGQSSISLSESGTNLLNVLGLTEGEGENEVIAQGSQTLGQNAIVYINDNKVVSTSNTITGESSGIANLSITIKKPTSDYSNNPDDEQSINLNIDPDYTKVKESLKTFVDAYNAAVTSTKSAVKSDGAIGSDSSLNAVLNSLRSLTSSVGSNDGLYSMLSQIGISTSKTDTTQLSIDEEKLDEALNKNFDSVKKLLSDGATATEDNGLFDKLLTSVNNALDSDRGYFSKKTESLESQISLMNTRIERASTSLTNYQTRITKQFNAMDSTLSSLNNQYSAFSALFKDFVKSSGIVILA